MPLRTVVLGNLGPALTAALLLAAIVVSRLLMPHMIANAMPDSVLSDIVSVAVGIVVAALLFVQTRTQKLATPAWAQRMIWIVSSAMVALAVARFAWTQSSSAGSPGTARAALIPYLELGTLLLVFRACSVKAATFERIASALVLLVAVTVVLDSQGLWPSSITQTPGLGLVSPRPGGILGNRNNAGELLGLFLPACIWMQSKRGRRWQLLLLFLLGMALALTRSRTGWIAAGAGGVLMFYLGNDTIRRHLLPGAACALLGMISAGLVPNRMQWKDENPQLATLQRLVEVDSGSGAMRVSQYEATLELMRSRWPMGAGMGQWRGMMHAAGSGHLAINRVPHSDYLRIMADCGILGLILLLAFHASIVCIAWSVKYPQIFCFALGLAIVCLADIPLYRMEAIAFCAAWVACALHDARERMQPGPS